ncbi:MAG TPA: TAT-variant-translocated molybdopterin oxidoreductase [Thermoanaerobaculia bacterium]|nr:TAT-variant-translocated molybdopterin oxidoreductase [Thermoanaerobaculia bacterium]
MGNKRTHLDLAKFRGRLQKSGGREYWKSLEDLWEDPEFSALIGQEFPQQAMRSANGFDRRNFLKLMGASIALGGLAACSRPAGVIVPYVDKPEEIVPGRPLFFATAMAMGGFGSGVLVESHEGRPTKIEGNPDHPASLGATDAWGQASILSLYDPDRSQTVMRLGVISTWTEFQAALQPVLQRLRQQGGAGLRLLTETVTSPTLGAQIEAFLGNHPGAVWHQWEPDSLDNVREGSRLAFGTYTNTVYRFDQADVVVSLDSDFLSSGPGHVRYTRDFMTKRRVRSDRKEMNRLYAIHSTPSPTSSIADHRFAVRPSEVESIARELAAGLGLGASAAAGERAHWIGAIARDLQQHRGASIVIAGPEQPPAVHAIAHAINGALGNSGRTLIHTDSPEVGPVNQLASIRQLAADIDAGSVEALLIIGGNPVFTAPADLAFGERMNRVPFRVRLGDDYDETSLVSHWHLPQTHYLEMWSDVRAFDGTVSIVQPLIAPLYNGRSPHELMALLNDDANEPYEIVRSHWRRQAGAGFDQLWRESLHRGAIAGSPLPARALTAAMPPPPDSPAAASPALELVFRPDPTIRDGRFANNGWLQELPKPLTKITWDNPALLSPSTAAKLGLADGEMVRLHHRGVEIEIPVFRVPGHADDVVTLHYGNGRRRVGRVGEGTGFDVYPLRSSAAPWIDSGVRVEKLGRTHPIASTQLHQMLETSDYDRRSLVKSGTLAGYLKDPSLAPHHEEGAPVHHEQGIDEGPTLYPAWKYDGYAWAMAIDTNVCTGCNGCVIACQSENNIPIVGKEEVLNHREMHWLRIDHYYKGTPESPESFHQPLPCMHCENAPCEPVCPVEATSHSSEGLNEMTYNRCVGTRYCANNCPYKVRRFNFFDYSDYATESLKPMRNPDVTVRTRGVMEKCSYCVQRINQARRDSEREGRTIRDGEFTTACAAACPSEAIVFGDKNDPKSLVSRLRAEPAHYGLLVELNTQPRTTYLAALRNPNPEIEAE